MKIMVDIDKKTMKNLKTIYIKNGVSEEPVNITEIVRKVANGKPVRKGKWKVVTKRLADGTVIPGHSEVCSLCFGYAKRCVGCSTPSSSTTIALAGCRHCP